MYSQVSFCEIPPKPKGLGFLSQIGEIDEVIAYFPEYKEQITEMRRRFDNLANEFQNEFERIQHLYNNRKAFAEEAKNFKCPAVLFTLLDKKVKDANEYVLNMGEEVLLKLLN